MVARLGAQIGTHLLVAICTQDRLRIAVKLDVTLLAIIFPLDMALYEFARCQNRLKTLCPNSTWQCPRPHDNGQRDEKPLQGLKLPRGHVEHLISKYAPQTREQRHLSPANRRMECARCATKRTDAHKPCTECVNDFATPCVINLLRMVVLFQSFSFAQVVG